VPAKRYECPSLIFKNMTLIWMKFLEEEVCAATIGLLGVIFALVQKKRLGGM